jgi:hypothetical protein
MIVTVFRSRLREGVREEYVALAKRINELARTIPGYVSHKDFMQTTASGSPSSNLRMKRVSAPGRPIRNTGRRRSRRARNITRSTTFRFAGSSACRNSSCPEKRRHRLDPRS